MKTKFLRSLALLALCSLSSLAATEIPVPEIPARFHANGTHVAPGTARVMVATRLGHPSLVLPEGSWLYSGYSASRGDTLLLPNGTLVVRFQAHRVASLAIADQATVVALRQAPRRATPDTILTAANDRR